MGRLTDIRSRLDADREECLGRRVSSSSSRRDVLRLLGVTGLVAAWGGCDCNPTLTVYLVRHAEKRRDEGDDPELTTTGKQRAQGLVKALDGVKLAAIYATPYKRTQQTVEPAAAARGMQVATVDAGDVRGLVTEIRRHQGSAVLVSGHSNTIPAIAAELGLAEPIALKEDDYGDLFVVTISGSKVTLERRRFEPQ